MYTFEADTQPQLSVCHLTPEPNSYDNIQLYFPLDIAYVQENLRPCFRVWIAQALTLPLGYRKVRFNLFLKEQIDLHAMSHRAMSQGGLPPDVCRHIIDDYVK